MNFIASIILIPSFLCVASTQPCDGTLCGYANGLCCPTDTLCTVDEYDRPRCSVPSLPSWSSMSVTKSVTMTRVGVWTSASSETEVGGEFTDGSKTTALYTCSLVGGESSAGLNELYSCGRNSGSTLTGISSSSNTESASSTVAASSTLTTDAESTTPTSSLSDASVTLTSTTSSGGRVGRCWYRSVAVGLVVATVLVF